jgi:Fanconi anemia group M protein
MSSSSSKVPGDQRLFEWMRNTMADQHHRVHVDYSERDAPLLELIRECGVFNVQMARLKAGDYLIDDEILIERKTIVDFSTSLVDGRLFPQASRLAHSPHRSVVLIEGPPARAMPEIHPHAILGAIVSLAAMWRLPVLHTSGPEDSLRVVRFLANQAARPRQPILRRYDRKPKRLTSRRIFMLQGLPGVGPALAIRLLNQLGSVEGVVTADVERLLQVRGVGPKKAARIRELVGLTAT